MLREGDIRHYVDNFSYLDINEEMFSEKNAKHFLEEVKASGMSFGELIAEVDSVNSFQKPFLSFGKREQTEVGFRPVAEIVNNSFYQL